MPTLCQSSFNAAGGGSAHLEKQVTKGEGPLPSHPPSWGAMRILFLVRDLENVLI